MKVFRDSNRRRQKTKQKTLYGKRGPSECQNLDQQWGNAISRRSKTVRVNMKRSSSLDLLWSSATNRAVKCNIVSNMDYSPAIADSRPQSEYAGVVWDVFSYKWKAELHIAEEGDRLFLGLFENDRDAAICVNQKCAERGIEPLNPELVEKPRKREPQSLNWENAMDKWRGNLASIQKDHDEIMKTLFDCEQDLLQADIGGNILGDDEWNPLSGDDECGGNFLTPDETRGEASPLSSISSSSFGLYDQTAEGMVTGSETDIPAPSEPEVVAKAPKKENDKRSPEAKQLKTMPVWYPLRSRNLNNTLRIEPSQRRYEDVEYIHCLIVGSSNAGKLALVDRYIYDDFLDIRYRKKIHRKISNSGEALDTHRAPFIVINHEAFCPILHNSSGVELTNEFLDTTNYLDNMDAFVFVYNIVDRKSFEELQLLHQLIYKSRLKRGQEGPLPAILVATALDCADANHSKDRFIWDLSFSHLRSYFPFTITTTILSFLEYKDSVSWFEGWSLAKRWNLPFLETSAKTGFNVEEAFHATFREAQNPMVRMFSRFTLHRKRSFVNVISSV